MIIEGFTPTTALIGGACIGLSAVLLMGSLGRIAGISGILSGSLFSGAGASVGSRAWRLSFLAGLVLAPLGLSLLGYRLPPVEITGDWGRLVLAGLLVGYGTRLGSGCTSGHGVCGLARFSGRSLVAVMVFLATAILTVAFMSLLGV